MEFSNKYRRLTDLIPFLVDDKTGIIKEVFPLEPLTDSPRFHYYKAIGCNTSVLKGFPNTVISAGTSSIAEKAYVKAVGEAIERYSSALYDYSELPYGNVEDLDLPALDPRELRNFNSDQYADPGFELERFNSASSVHWVKAKKCHTNEHVYFPAALCYCPYYPNASLDEKRIAENISTGLAAHCSYQETAINGLLEVVERNNFMFHWLTAIAPPKVNLQSLPDALLELISRYNTSGYRFSLYDIRGRDGIPSFMGKLESDNSDLVPIIIGATAHLSKYEGIQKCIEELALMERFSRKAMQRAGQKKYKSFSEVKNLTDHVNIWLDRDFTNNAGFLDLNKRIIDYHQLNDFEQSNPENDLKCIVDRIRNIGFECYYADLTSRDIAGLGLHVGRAIVPGYIPLNKSYINRPLGSRYLIEYFESARTELNSSIEINPVPHPFA